MIITACILSGSICLSDSTRKGHVFFMPGGGLKTLSHAAGFSCVVSVDDEFNLTIELDQASYPNITEVVYLRLTDGSDKKLYEFNSLAKFMNNNGDLVDLKLNLKYQDVRRDELEKALKRRQQGVLSVCVIDNNDLHVGVHGNVYVFKDISRIHGLRVDENHLKAALPILLSGDFSGPDFKLQTQWAQEKHEYWKLYLMNQSLEKTVYIADQERAFQMCLSDHRSSSNITAFGIPESCESYAISLKVLGCGCLVTEMINEFRQVINK